MSTPAEQIDTFDINSLVSMTPEQISPDATPAPAEGEGTPSEGTPAATEFNNEAMAGMMNQFQSMQNQIQQLSTQTQQPQQSPEMQALMESQQNTNAALKQILESSSPQQQQTWLTPEFEETVGEIAPALNSAAEFHSRQAANQVATQMQEVFGNQLAQMQDAIKQVATTVETQGTQTLMTQVNAAHPDYDQIQVRPDFQAFRNKIDPRTGFTNGELMDANNKKGNAAGNIAIVADFKQQAGITQAPADTVHPVSVPGGNVTAATNPVTSVQGKRYKAGDITAAQQQWRSGQITGEQYNAFKAEFKKAEKDGRIIY